MRRGLKGMVSIHYVMVAIAGIVAVALVLAAAQGWFDTLLGDFAGSVSYPQQ